MTILGQHLLGALAAGWGVVSCGFSILRLGFVSPWLFANHPMPNPPPSQGCVWAVMRSDLGELLPHALLKLVIGEANVS